MAMRTASLKKIFSILLSIIIGGIFIFSAISKIPTLEQFGWTIVETTFLNWTAAEWSARLLVALELFLGVLFVMNFKLKKIAIPISLLLLSVFTIYLMLVIKTQGNSGNCGCFGDVVQMTPMQSIWKNIGLIILILTLFAIQWEWSFKYSTLLTTLLFLVTGVVPFLLSPPESIYIMDENPWTKEPIPLSILYNSSTNQAPKEELRKGKHVLLFMSLTCGHCRKAAKRVRIMKEKNPEIPFYAILNGDSTNIKDFFDDTKMLNVPYSTFNGAEEFLEMNKTTALPSIKWMEDTNMVKVSNYLNLDENEIKDWLKK